MLRSVLTPMVELQKDEVSLSAQRPTVGRIPPCVAGLVRQVLR